MESEAKHCSEATSSLDAFDIQTQVRLFFGPGAVESGGEHAAGLGGKRILLVTDEGIVKAGHAAKAIEHLQSAGLEVATFASVRKTQPQQMSILCRGGTRSQNRFASGPGRWKQHGYGQGVQLHFHQRWENAGLLGYWKGASAHASPDCDTHYRRNRKRMSVLCVDC